MVLVVCAVDGDFVLLSLLFKKGQYVVTEGNWANDTACGCRDGFVATGDGVNCECASGTFLAQVRIQTEQYPISGPAADFYVSRLLQIEGTSGDANKYCAVPRTYVYACPRTFVVPIRPDLAACLTAAINGVST